MTGNHKLFSTYTGCDDMPLVKITDGTTSIILGIGSVDLGSNICLTNVMYIPSFSKINLISINKLTSDIKCKVVFDSSSCLFQDQILGRTIGHAKEHSGLYYYLQSTNKSCQTVSLTTPTRHQQIMIIHKSLGHPAFRIYVVYFLIVKKIRCFFCDIFQMAKHQRATCFQIPYKASQPFALIHSAIWGLSRINTLSNKRWFLTFIDDHTRMS